MEIAQIDNKNRISELSAQLKDCQYQSISESIETRSQFARKSIVQSKVLQTSFVDKFLRKYGNGFVRNASQVICKSEAKEGKFGDVFRIKTEGHHSETVDLEPKSTIWDKPERKSVTEDELLTIRFIAERKSSVFSPPTSRFLEGFLKREK